MPDAFAFNAREVAPAEPRSSDPVPPGWYRAWIIDSEMKPNKAGTGRYLELTWEIVEGPHAKRRIWDRLNVENPKQTAQDIAREALSAICHATDVLEMTHTGQLHGIVCAVKVQIERQPGYNDKNIIKGYAADGDPRASNTTPAKIGAGARQAVPGQRHPALEDKDDDELPF